MRFTDVAEALSVSEPKRRPFDLPEVLVIAFIVVASAIIIGSLLSRLIANGW